MNFSEFLATVSGRDLLDIAAVAIVVYTLLLLIRGTRAVQVILGILVLVGITYLARAFDLIALSRLLQNFVVILPFAVIVMFQDQIRRALASFGDTSLFIATSRAKTETSIGEITKAASQMAKQRIGALIVVEATQGLRDYIERGIAIDAEVSSQLLCNIFNPGAPLHDGAALLQGDRIAAAACFLPLSKQGELDPDLGTRHRAALGVSEQTDCAAVVVSEETGQISLAIHGVLNRDLDIKELSRLLLEHLTAATSRTGKTESVDSNADESSQGDA